MNLEPAIDAARSGLMEDVELIGVFADAPMFYVGQLADEDDLSSFQPLVLAPPAEAGAEAQQMVVLFTDPNRIPEEARERGSMMLQVTGRQVLETLPEGLGIAINPGGDPSMELPASSIPAVRRAIPEPPEDDGPDAEGPGAEGPQTEGPGSQG